MTDTRTIRRRAIVFLAAGLTLSALTASAAPADSARIDPAAFGKPIFVETFQTLDAGQDQPPRGKPHRWRTVHGYGDAADAANRNGILALYVDGDFGGIAGGKALPGSLNINPFEHRPGLLTIVARPSDPSLRSKLLNKPYTSGLLNTRLSFAAKNAYFEGEIKLPRGRGLFPAFWLMPQVSVWPEGGEIDIMEQLGKDTHVAFASIHAKNIHHTKEVKLGFDAAGDFHRYGVAYTPTEIVWYFDRREVHRMPTPPDVKDPMYILLNLAVGGDWAGEPDASTPFPARMHVREIKVWSLPPSWSAPRP